MPAIDEARARSEAEAAQAEIGPTLIESSADVVKVSVIGIGMRSHAGVASQAFTALACWHQHPRDHHLGDQQD